MKDVFATRAEEEFWKLLGEFCDSLMTTFPDCTECKDWHLWLNNIVIPEPQAKKKGISKWVEHLSGPLKKGCAKYTKAVLSITETAPIIVHAVCYHDVDAAHASCEWIQGFNFPEKLQAMGDEEKAIFWQYFEELNTNAFKALRKPLPKVPTSAEIAENIAQRRGQKQSSGGPSSFGGTSQSNSSLNQGIVEAWKQLLIRRECSSTTCDDSVLKRLKEFSNSAFVEQLKQKDEATLAKFLSTFPELGDAPLTAEDADIVLKVMNFIVMDASIPNDMMKGIESMASKLVDGIASGDMTLADLNVESIGQQVLQGVSQKDINEFAENIDKIMPALGGLKQ